MQLFHNENAIYSGNSALQKEAEVYQAESTSIWQ